jgi:hypothetical protein
MAKVINFPRAARRRAVRQQPAPVGYISRVYYRHDAGGFILLLFLTIPAAFLYLSGAADVARHDTLYASLLVVVWGLYFFNDKLLQTRLGPPLRRIGRLLLLAGIAGFFGGIYWLILGQ